MYQRPTSLLLLLLPTLVSAQMISGRIIDQTSQQPLSYVSVQWQGTLQGTTSDTMGQFFIHKPHGSDSLIFAYLGYRHHTIHLSTSDTLPMEIRLTPVHYSLQEVIVRSMSPEDYVRSAIAAYPQNFSSTPFSTTALFTENLSLENHKGMHLYKNEGVLTSFYEDYVDTTSALNVLNLYTADSMSPLPTILYENKRLSNHNDNEQEDLGLLLPINNGPQLILKMAQGVTTLPFLQEENFKRVLFSFGPHSTFMGRKLISIPFRTRKNIDQSSFEGTIYLDTETLSFVTIQYIESIRLPFYINLALGTFAGFKIKDIKMEFCINNQVLQDKWYPKQIWGQLNFYFKQKGEKENWKIRQWYSISKINHTNALKPTQNIILKADKPLQDQVHNPEGLTWKDVNRTE